MVRITHLLDKMPSQCSGGESQRVALARTLVTNPSTFLLDEPLSSLDAKLRRELRAECDRLHQALKRTFIYVTHDQEEAMTLADRIVVMRAGEIVQVGSPMEIYSNPVNYFVADFFGSPSMNLLAGEIVRKDGTRAISRARASSSPCPSASRRQQPGPPRSASGPSMSASRSAATATSSFRCDWSSRSAGTRCSISMPAPSGHSSRSAKVSTWPTSRSARASRSPWTRAGSTCSAPTEGGSGAASSTPLSEADNAITNERRGTAWTTARRAKSATACGSTGTCRSRWTTASCCDATSIGRSPRASIR